MQLIVAILRTFLMIKWKDFELIFIFPFQLLMWYSIFSTRSLFLPFNWLLIVTLQKLFIIFLDTPYLFLVWHLLFLNNVQGEYLPEIVNHGWILSVRDAQAQHGFKISIKSI